MLAALSKTSCASADQVKPFSAVLVSWGTRAIYVGLSSSRFQHLFKDNVGVSFRRFRLWARMRVAIRLALGGASLTQAAMEAGLSSSAHLSTAFKGMFGISPSQLISVEPLYLET
jgi:AraC-like DNA-binding protein